MKYSTSLGFRIATASAAVALTGALVLPQAAFAASNAGYVWPLKTAGTVTQQFGHNGHTGTDIATKKGTDVLAMASGTVKYVQPWDGHSKSGMQSYGNLVIIYHPSNKMATYYAHLSDISVHEGQTVDQGQVIGHVGSTGNSTGNHLHVETRKNAKSAQGTYGKGDGTCVNTLDYVSPSDNIPAVEAAPGVLAGRWGSDTTDLPQGYTVIRLKDTNLALTVIGDGNDDDNSRRVRVTTADGSASQQWKFEPQGDGSFKLKSAAYDVVLDIRNGSTSNGAEVWTWASNDAPEERFYAERIEGDDYALRNAKSSLYVNIGDKTKVKSGDKVTLWTGPSGDGRAADQTWTIEEVGASEDSEEKPTGTDTDTQAITDGGQTDNGGNAANGSNVAEPGSSATSNGSSSEEGDMGTDSNTTYGSSGNGGSNDSENGNANRSGGSSGSGATDGNNGGNPTEHFTDHDTPTPYNGNHFPSTPDNETANDTGDDDGTEADGSLPSIWDGLMSIVSKVRKFFESL